MKYIIVTLIVLILAGCSHYDIDVSCPLANYGSIESTEGTMRIYCTEWKNDFDIRCIQKTVQNVHGEYSCTKPDGKSVRIKIQN